MNPIFDIKGEHAAITIILNAMNKLALDMRKGKFIDSYRIVQILDFLHTFSEHCHHEKEEKCLYPAILGHDIPWTADTIHHLINEQKTAHDYIKEIDSLFEEYLSGNTQIIDNLAQSMIKYVELEKNHIKILDCVVLPLCERILDTNTIRTISSDFRKIQDRNVGQMKHHEYYKLMAILNEKNEVISERIYLY